MKRAFAKRFSAVLVSAFMLAGVLPAAVKAYGGEARHDISSESVILTESECGNDCKGHIISGKTKVNWIAAESGTHNVTLENADIYSDTRSPFEISAGTAVSLTVEGKNRLASFVCQRAALQVPDGAALTITEHSTGTLDVSGAKNAAGIGSSYNENAGRINIFGGKIHAEGGYDAASIGCGAEGGGGEITFGKNASISLKSIGGFGCGIGGRNTKIYITGGRIEATASSCSSLACIGGANADVYISGGVINFSGLGFFEFGPGAAGIDVYKGRITITGGDLNISFGYYAPAVRGGKIYISGGNIQTYTANYNSIESDDFENGEIIINGGNVFARSDDGAGIVAKSITIASGNVTAYGSNNTAIGCEGGNIAISGGYIAASGSGTDLGGGNGSITITGGNILNTSYKDLVIGGEGDKVTITGGNVYTPKKPTIPETGVSPIILLLPFGLAVITAVYIYLKFIVQNKIQKV